MTHLCNAQYQTVMQVGLEKARLARHVLHKGMWLDDFFIIVLSIIMQAVIA